jgi:hypothetical protein
VHRTNITAQIDLARRAAFLALCREKAIGMVSYGACSVETRAAVFYELLVNLLRGRGDRRALLLESGPFTALPAREQARLLRLTAADAIVHHDADDATIHEWLERAALLGPYDWRSATLARLHRISPGLCRGALRCLAPFRGPTQPVAPFADLEEPVQLTASTDHRR